MILTFKIVAVLNKRKSNHLYLPIQNDILGTKTYVFGIESIVWK
jgi:hypothetical protein